MDVIEIIVDVESSSRSWAARSLAETHGQILAPNRRMLDLVGVGLREDTKILVAESDLVDGADEGGGSEIDAVVVTVANTP